MTKTGIRKDPKYMRKYSADYYQKNKQRMLDYRKDYYQKHKDRYKKLTQTRLEKMANNPEYRKANLQYLKGRREKYRIMVVEILGKTCVLCNEEGNLFGRTHTIEYHEIHGKPHVEHPYYTFKHIKDFVPLCWKCHRTIHFFARMKDKEKAKELIENL
jgi:hypothetical protein